MSDPQAETIPDGSVPTVPTPVTHLAETLRDVDGSTTISEVVSIRLPTRIAKANPLAPESAGLVDRYRVEALAGSGATSQVLAVTDHVFDRQVAVKFLHGAKAEDPKRLGRFIHEAKLTASLEHPNITPIYDLDFTEDGSAYFTMRLIRGSSLGDLLRTAETGAVPAAIDGLYVRIGIFLKVLDALASAHARGILHRDIKPDNIMIGDFGEVFLVDWGCAQISGEGAAEHSRQRPRRLVGTPNYMSPEQARTEVLDARTDVYGVGATLFHLLYGRVPTTGTDVVDFWARKRAGIIDAPTKADRAQVPRQLRAIVLTALAPTADARYPNVAALAVDLRAWQSGLSISAYRESLGETLARWHRLRWRELWTAAVVVLLIATAVGVVWGERLKSFVTWGPALAYETFSDDRWQERWLEHAFDDSQWAVENGRLVSQGPLINVVWFREPFNGSMAIEYEGEMLPGHLPCDLSVVLSERRPGDANLSDLGVHFIQVGAFDNSYAMIKLADGTEIQAPWQLDTGRRYRIRIEVVRETVSIFADGQLLCTFARANPFSTFWVGLYGYYPGKAFDEVQLHTLGIPERISALIPGERDYTRGMYAPAAEYFSQLAELHERAPIAEEARYRAGLAWLAADNPTAAAAAWDAIRDPYWQHRAVIERTLRRIADGSADDIAQTIPEVLSELTNGHHQLRPRLVGLWNTAVARAFAVKDNHDAFSVLLAARQRWLANERGTDVQAARVLHRLGRWQEVVDQFPHVIDRCADSLIRLGRADEAYARFSHRPFQAGLALAEMGRFEDLLAQPVPPWLLSRIHFYWWRDPTQTQAVSHQIPVRILLGEAQTWLAEAKGDDRIRYLVALGREDEVEITERGIEAAWAFALRTERPPEVTAYLETFITPDFQLTLAIDAAMQGDEARARTILADMRDPMIVVGDGHRWADAWLIQPWLAEILGESGAFAAAQQKVLRDGRWWQAQRPWYVAAWLTGEIDDARYLAQPVGNGVEASLQALRAIRADHAGDTVAALAHYQAFFALSPAQRSIIYGRRCASLEHLFRWRQRELTALNMD